MPRLHAAFCLLVLTVVAPASSRAETPAPDTSFQPDPASVRRYGPAYRYPQDGWIVLHIEGAPYDRGYQNGTLMSREIADYVDTLAKARTKDAPEVAWEQTRTLVNVLFLRKYDPEYLEEMKGIADGASAAGAKFHGRALDLIDIAAVNSEVESFSIDAALESNPTGLEGKTFKEPQFPREKPEREEHCSAFAATGPATADGKIVIGHITMFTLYYTRHFNVWLDIKPETGHRVLMQTYPGGIQSGLDYYQNDNGLILTETTIGQTKYGYDSRPLPSRVRKAMQYANSIDDAVSHLKDGNNGLYTNEWILGDTKTNEIAMFELGTHKTKLWRSSKNEWPAGTVGFYYGCNNAKDLDVRLETVASVEGKPANMVFRPSDRDRKWVELYEKHKGKIGPEFGFEAFTTPPLSAHPSCDAKFTTAAMARDLKCFALFGPPLGKTWEPTQSDRNVRPDIQPLVSNDWTILRADALTLSAETRPAAVDLEGKTSDVEEAKPESRLIHNPAWHGTIIPGADPDLWLAASFSDFEKIVSLENALVDEQGKLSEAAQERIDRAMYVPLEAYRSAVRRLGHDVPLNQIQSDMSRSEMYDIAAGKGVLLLHAVRSHLGKSSFDQMMDRFGRDHAGKPATTDEFRRACETLDKTGEIAPLLTSWITRTGLPDTHTREGWSINTFEFEPDQTMIVYGTLRDIHAQREAAKILQERIANRWGNYSVSIKSDEDVTDEDLKSHHVLLIGRPGTNRTATRFADSLPVSFGRGSFRIGEDTYAHAGSAIVAAGPNPLSPSRYSMVVYAGLSATSTRNAIHKVFDRNPGVIEAVLMADGSTFRPIILPVRTGKSDVAE